MEELTPQNRRREGGIRREDVAERPKKIDFDFKKVAKTVKDLKDTGDRLWKEGDRDGARKLYEKAQAHIEEVRDKEISPEYRNFFAKAESMVSKKLSLFPKEIPTAREEPIPKEVEFSKMKEFFEDQTPEKGEGGAPETGDEARPREELSKEKSIAEKKTTESEFPLVVPAPLSSTATDGTSPFPQDHGPEEVTSRTKEEHKEEIGTGFPWPSLLKTRMRQVTVLGIAALLLLLVLNAAFFVEDSKLTVNSPAKMVGDKIVYDVDGQLKGEADVAFETEFGLLKGFNIDLEGFLSRQVNGTTLVKDGFDDNRKTLEEYLQQDLNMSGSVDLVGLTPNLRDGKLVTHQTDYTDLRKNTTIRYDLSNRFEITLPTADPPLFSKRIYSMDRGTFFTNFASSATYLNFLSSDFQKDLIPQTITEGDSGESPDSNLKWEAKGSKNIRGFDSVEVLIQEKEPQDWYKFELRYWISSDCSYPTRIELKGWVDAGKLEGDLFIDVARLYLHASRLEIDYKAELQNYRKGQEEIPPGMLGNSKREYHPQAEGNFVDWYPENKYRVPVVFKNPELNTSSGFTKDHRASDAYDYALENDEEIANYFKENKNAYAVSGEYFHDKEDKPVWNFTFGYYRSLGIEDLFNIEQTGYQTRLAGILNDTNVSFEQEEKGEADILTPDLRNSDLKGVLSLAVAEQIFKLDENTRDLAFMETEDGEDHVIDFSKTKFRWASNPIGPSAGIISSMINQVIPIEIEVPSLFSYHLVVDESNPKEETTLYHDAMLNGETGMRIYLRYHEDNFL